MKAALITIVIVLGAVLFFGRQQAVIKIDPSAASEAVRAPEGIQPVSAVTTTIPNGLPEAGLPPLPLAHPPAVIQAKYFSAWVAGSNRRMQEFLANAERTHINAVVIDIKDYSGYVSYAMQDPAAKASGAERQLRIANIDKLVRDLHDKNIYIIGRVTVFQDPIFAAAHPELALKDKKTGGLWKDAKGLAWLDPAGKPTWEYVSGLANDAFAHGLDEVNFDYVRFPSDGDLDNAAYPFWDETKPRHEVLRGFFAYLRQTFPDRKISADLFGLTVVDRGDMGIGQQLEDALPYFDYVAPMVYPSHFGPGTFGFKKPAEHPYEMMQQSLSVGLSRRQKEAASSTLPLAKFRPWVQVFDLGAVYTPQMVSEELRAADDVFKNNTEAYGGWLLWDPNNIYRSYDASF